MTKVDEAVTVTYSFNRYLFKEQNTETFLLYW